MYEMNYQLRIENLRKKLSARRLQGILITASVNIFYFTGLRVENCALVITEKDISLFASPLLYQQILDTPLKVKIDIYAVKDGIIKGLVKWLVKKKFRFLGIEERRIAYDFWKKISSAIKINWQGADEFIEKMREIKDEEEITCIRQACRIAHDAFVYAQQITRPGLTERELVRELEYFMKKQGADKSSFEIIVAGGKNSAYPHHFTSDYIFQNDDLVLIDLGCFYKRYASDLTRVIYLGKIEKISPQLVKIAKIVEKANQKATEEIRTGVAINKIDKSARQIIAEAGFKDNFTHNTGHGVGLEIHEQPYITPKNKTILRTGMVITVEPGIYLPNIGGVRIEDTVLVKENGAEVL